MTKSFFSDLLESTNAVREQRVPQFKVTRPTPSQSKTRGRCPVCGMKMRSVDHDKGAVHQKALKKVFQ
jgi:hypothetical protein